jgi:hypothetical protein
MQNITQTAPLRQHGPFRLIYRHTPGSLGDNSSLDNGAVMTLEFRLRKSRDKRLSELGADRRIQWVREI